MRETKSKIMAIFSISFYVLSFLIYLLATATLIGEFMPRSEPDSITLFISLLVMLVGYAIFSYLIKLRLKPEPPDKLELGELKSNKLILRLIFSACFLSIIIILFFALTSEIFPLSEMEMQFQRSFAKYIWYGLLSSLIIAPIFEEVFFRRFVLSYLLKYLSPKFAIIISALIFGAFHMNVRQFILASVLGLFLGAVYYRTGNLKYSIAMHLAFNIFGLIIPIIILTLRMLNHSYLLIFIGMIALLFGANSIKKLVSFLKSPYDI